MCGLPKYDPDTKQFSSNRLASQRPRRFPDAELDAGWLIGPDFKRCAPFLAVGYSPAFAVGARMQRGSSESAG